MSWRDYPCKLWPGAKNNPDGYGVRRINKQLHYVHRWAWIEAYGPIPPETPFVLHHCDVKTCYEVEHLFLGTQADNMADMSAKGRGASQIKTHCPQGHAYDETNTYVNPASGGRVCRLCQRIGNRERKRAKRQAA